MKKASYRVRLSTAPLSTPIDDDMLDLIVEAVERQRGITAPIVAANVAVRSVTLTASVDVPSPVDAVGRASAAFIAALRKAGIDDVDFVEVSAEIEDASGDRQELLAGAEVARRLGLSRERVRQLATMPGRFPTAVATVGTYRVWRWGDVTDWARANQRPVKTPRKRTRAA